MLISYGGPRRLVHTAAFVLVSVTCSKQSSILFRHGDIGGNGTKKSKGMNDRNQDWAMSGERAGDVTERATWSFQKNKWGHMGCRLIFFKPYCMFDIHSSMCIYI